MSVIKPICAICNKPVDLFWYIRNPVESTGTGEYIYIAKCHGAAEQVTITDADILLMSSNEITLGVAFTQKALP